MRPKSLCRLLVLLVVAQLSIGAFAFPVCHAKAAGGTTYYVANAGNDACNGTSPAIGTSGNCAWQTIAHVNAQTFNPGDSILFNKGDTWREELAPPSSGSAGNPITFGAYGRGAQPIISAANLVTSWTPQTITHNSFTNDPNIQAYWSMEEATGATSADGTANGNNLSNTGGVAQSSTHMQGFYSASFNGRSQYLSRTDATLSANFPGKSSTTTNDMTFGAWVQLGALASGNHPFFDKPGSIEMFYAYNSNNAFCVQLQYGSYAVACDLGGRSANTWYHVVGRFKGSTNQELSIFVDGTEQGTTTGTAPLSTTTQPFYIGTDNYRGHLNGLVDEVFVFNRALSNSEIAQIYSTGLAGTSFTVYYATSISANPKQVFEDGTRLTPASATSSIRVGSWWWDATSTKLYVRTFQDASPMGHTIEASVRPLAVDVNAQTYVTVTGLDLEKALNNDIDVLNVASNFTLSSSTVNNSAYNGIYISAPVNLSTPSQSIVIQDSTFAYNGEVGITSNGNTASLLIQGNTVYNNCLAIVPGYTPDCAGIYAASDAAGPGGTPLARPSNVIAQYNQVYSNGIDGTEERGYGVWFDTIGAGSQIRYNTTYNNTKCGIQLEYPSDSGDTGKVESVTYNLSYNNLYCGVILSRHSHNSVIANNTTYGNQDNIIVQGDGTNENIRMDNNIISNNISFGWTSYSLVTQYGGENDGTNGSGNIYTYNALGAAASNFIQWGMGVSKSNYSAWETATGNCGTTGCSHSVQYNPGLNDPAGNNFTLTSSSPAIDTGLNLGSTYQLGLDPVTSWPSSIILDNQSNNGTGWEIGAYVYPNSTDGTLSGPAISSGTLSATFSSSTTSYPDSVSNGVTSVTVTPTADQAGSTITVNDAAVGNGSASNPIPLNIGSNTLLPWSPPKMESRKAPIPSP